MTSFTLFDAGRFKEEKYDCVVRALSIAFDVPYYQVHDLLKWLGRKDRHYTKLSASMYAIVLLGGWLCDCDGTISQFCGRIKKGTFIIRIRGHMTCVKNGVVFDMFPLGRHRIKRIWEVKK